MKRHHTLNDASAKKSTTFGYLLLPWKLFKYLFLTVTGKFNFKLNVYEKSLTLVCVMHFISFSDMCYTVPISV